MDSPDQIIFNALKRRVYTIEGFPVSHTLHKIQKKCMWDNMAFFFLPFLPPQKGTFSTKTWFLLELNLPAKTERVQKSSRRMTMEQHVINQLQIPYALRTSGHQYLSPLLEVIVHQSTPMRCFLFWLLSRLIIH